MDVLVAGPGWTSQGLDIAAGRYPLQVEAHVMRLVALLVPGVTTVTPHGRYYALHGLVASEAARLELSAGDALDLLRRCEVILGAVSVLHESKHDSLPRAHGADAIAPRLRRDGRLVLAEVSKNGKGGYVEAQRGFWAPYVGSEQLLEIVSSPTELRPGPTCDRDALMAGLGDVFDLATREEVDVDTLTAAEHLCLCRGSDAPDGAWLRELMCAVPQSDASAGFAKLAHARRDTIRLLARVVAAGGVERFGDSFKLRVAFGSFVDDDPIAAMLEAVAPWRGTLLRHYSVGSWRRIWSWLVDRVAGLTLADDVASDFADALPSGTVGEFTLGLPAILVNGIPAPAEENARGDDQRSVPDRELAVIAMGAMRLDTLAGPARDAFAGRPIELSPAWVGRRLDDWRGRSLRDFGVELVNDLLTRARRVAMSKMQRRPDGTLWLPTRLYERGDYLWRTSREGAGDVGLRIDQLGTVLAEAGVFRHGADGWAVTAAGEAVLD